MELGLTIGSGQDPLAKTFIDETSYPALLPRELSFLLNYGVERSILDQAARLAHKDSIPSDVALLRYGLVNEDTFFRALAQELDVPFQSRFLRLAATNPFPESVLAGIAVLDTGRSGERRFALAPGGERLSRILSRRLVQKRGFVVTTPTALRDNILEVKGVEIAHHAAYELAEARPERSFHSGITKAQRKATLWLISIASLMGFIAPFELLLSSSLVMAVLFLLMISVRLAAMLERVDVTPRFKPQRAPDDELPVYTIIVPLYREERVLERLIGAMNALDYPHSKLDIKLVVEEHDLSLRAALTCLELPSRFEVIVAPHGEPRTKPRALNVALPLARGEYVVVFDAEDVPDPSQLRLAASFFERAPLDVACLQARLVIDNTEDSWLTRFFTLEYACLFDVINPGLAALGLPIPLGGTSNHFRIKALRSLYGWDAWNVTEDADLGMRAALAGYRILDLPSSTYEEAPAHLAIWMRQRSRWMKGYMQTCITHSRRPVATLNALGLTGWFASITLTFGTVMAALLFPILQGAAFYALSQGHFLNPQNDVEMIVSALGLTLLVTGWIAMLLPHGSAMTRRGLWHLWPYALLMPIYYIGVSVAAWWALYELIRSPSHWHKTEHGLALTSRTGALITKTAGLLPRQQAGGPD
jgi:glycosyltransferase XagB